jgi:hypothetical protein
MNTPCKQLQTCIQFQDFIPSNPNYKLYVSPAQTLTVNCPSGTTASIAMPAGIIGYTLKFAIGDSPYPNISMNCTNGFVSYPVPANVTQPQLDAIIYQMLNACVAQIAQSIACQAGVFLNTQQTYNPCGGALPNTWGQGGIPAGVTPQNSPSATPVLAVGASILSGTIQSNISQTDANSKALALLSELYSTGNLICHS